MPSSRQETRLPLPERTLISPRSRSSICLARPAAGRRRVVGGGVVGGGVVGGGVGAVAEWWVAASSGRLVGAVPPVQVVPLSAKPAGTGLLASFHEPLKPKLAVPLVAIARVVADVRGGDLGAGLGDGGVPRLGDLLTGGVRPGQGPAVDRVAEVGDGDVGAEAAAATGW